MESVGGNEENKLAEEGGEEMENLRKYRAAAYAKSGENYRRRKLRQPQ